MTIKVMADWLSHASKKAAKLGRPLVTASFAQSVDGCLALRRGQPLALSSPESLIWTHEIRAMHQAILVGVGTVMADDPELTVRLVEGKSPIPIILDGALRLPQNSKLVQRKENLPWVFAAPGANVGKGAALQSSGVRLFRVSRGDMGLLDLPSILKVLYAEGIHSVMVEGGARIITSFFTKRLVDFVAITISPVFTGGLTAIEQPLAHGAGQVITLPYLVDMEVSRTGDDIALIGKVVERTA
jgi:3,4-dihydroxy 2-butanone 4-phosphate synthase/GTP cyclohydrolase II